MKIWSSFEGADMVKYRQKLLKDLPWLAGNYNLEVITARIKEQAWLKEGLHEMPGWQLMEAHSHLRADQKEALNAFRKRFLETFGESYEAVFPGDKFTDIGRKIGKELNALEKAFEDISGYNPEYKGTYRITKDGKLLAYQKAEVGSVGRLSEDVLLGKVAPKDCPHTIFMDGFEYPEGHPFHRQGELVRPQQINGADYAAGGRLASPAAPAEATPHASEPAKPAPAEPVIQKKIVMRATPGAQDLQAEKWTPQHVEAMKDRLRVEKVEVVKRPMQVLNAEGTWIDTEPLLVLKATKTVNGTMHTIELSGQDVIHAAKNPSKLLETQFLKESPVLGEFFQGHGLLEAPRVPPVSRVPEIPPTRPPEVSVGKTGASAAKAEEGIGQWVQRVFREHPGKSWGGVAAGAAAAIGIGYWAIREKNPESSEPQTNPAATR